MTLPRLKTYLCVIIGLLVEGAGAVGYLTAEQVRSVQAVLGFLGLAALRAGVAKAEDAAPKP